MVSKTKVAEIMLFCLANGEKETKEKFGLTDETWNRYKREYKKQYGAIDDILALKARFSEEELSHIAKGERPPLHNSVKHSFEGERLKLGIISDPHFGSIYTDSSLTEQAIEEFHKQKVDMIVSPGDLVEGMMGRPGDVYELSHIGYKAQRDEAIRVLGKKKESIPFYTISGNHDVSFNSKHGVGANIVEDICSAIPNAHYLGYDEGDIHIKNIVIRLFHGGDGSSYATSYRGQKLIESFSGGEKPALAITGHTHKQIYMFNRNVHYIEAGTLQYQSSWMRGKKLAAHVGFSIADLVIGDGEIKSLSYTWYPFYK